MTRREAEFDREQYLLLVASDELESDVGPHGHPMTEATSGEADPNNPDGAWFYRAGVPRPDRDGSTIYVPLIDYASKAREDAEDAFRASLGKDQKMPNGLVFPVTRVRRR